MRRHVPVHSPAPAPDGAFSLLFCTLTSSCSGAGRPEGASVPAVGLQPAPAVMQLAGGTHAARCRGIANGWTASSPCELLGCEFCSLGPTGRRAHLPVSSTTLAPVPRAHAPFCRTAQPLLPAHLPPSPAIRRWRLLLAWQWLPGRPQPCRPLTQPDSGAPPAPAAPPWSLPVGWPRQS